MGVLIDYESQKIKKTVLSTTVAELYSFMKYFGSCKFLRGLWIDISGEVANIHMNNGRKEPGNNIKNNSLTWTKETRHMISMLRKEDCSGGTHDVAHIFNWELFGRLSDEVISGGSQLDHSGKNRETTRSWHSSQISGHSWNTRPSCLPGVKTFLHTREKDVFFPNALKISLAPTPREGPFHVMFVRNQHSDEKHSICVNSRIKMLRKYRLHLQTHASTSPGRWCRFLVRTLYLCCCAFLPALWPCQHQNRSVLAEWTDGHGILNSAVKFFIMRLWRSPGTTSTWCLMRTVWNQKSSQRRLKTQALIQEPWE